MELTSLLHLEQPNKIHNLQVCGIGFHWLCALTSIVIIISLHLALPKVKIYGDDKLVQGYLKINCSVDSHSKPTTRWYQNNNLLSRGDSRVREVKSGYYKHRYWSNISLINVNTDDNMTCSAQNANGMARASYLVPCIAGKICISCASFQKVYTGLL